MVYETFMLPLSPSRANLTDSRSRRRRPGVAPLLRGCERKPSCPCQRAVVTPPGFSSDVRLLPRTEPHDCTHESGTPNFMAATHRPPMAAIVSAAPLYPSIGQGCSRTARLGKQVFYKTVPDDPDDLGCFRFDDETSVPDPSAFETSKMTTD